MTKLTYDGMLDALSNESLLYDAVVGDVTISAARSENGDFTQPYLDSGIVVLAPAVRASQHFPGVLFTPFTAQTWGVMGLSVVLTGIALWLLERNEHPHIGGGPSKSEQFKRAFWFVTSILVFFKRELIKNPLAKFVMIAWILFILLLGSSYTASLSSILTVYELSAEAKDISMLASENLPIGFQVGSIVTDYLTSRYNISNSRLIPLNSTDDYASALAKGPHVSGGVAAVIDEIPYISLFLAAQSDCKFSVSSKLTIEGFGFAFRNRGLAAAFSVAILNLSESGQMQKLKDGSKLSNYQCPSQAQSTRLDLKSSGGIFVLLGSAMFAFTVFYLTKPRWVQNSVLPRSAWPDRISAFREPSFHGSFRRWSSFSHPVPV